MTATADTIELRAGKVMLVRVGVQVADGYHVQANPASAEYLIPTVLSLDPGPDLQLGKVRYPQPEKHRLEGTDEDLATFAGRFDIVVPLHANPDAPASKRTLAGWLRFQACDDRTCLFPDSIPIAVPLRISLAGS